MTLFEKYGGVPAVTSVVKSFYKEVLANPRLKIYFAAANSDKLKDTLKAVLLAHHFEAADVAAVMALIEGFQGSIVELPTIVRTV